MNPFRVGQRVTGEFFTDRAEEVASVVRAMRDPTRLLVYGRRRMGKSSVIAMAAERVREDGGLIIEADLSTASALSDVTSRLLTSFHRAGEGDRPGLADMLKGLRVRLEIDDRSGLPAVAVEARERSSPPERQAGTLEAFLDRLNDLAGNRDASVAVVLDEFQEVVEIGPDRADWWLRSLMQRHDHLSYVCAGSRHSIIEQLLSKEGAFYGGFERLHVGPVDPEHLARWIDSRMEGAGVPAPGSGRRMIEVAGPRLQDIMTLARQCYYLAAARGYCRDEDIQGAVEEVIRGDDAIFQARWESLTPLQQNVLRAVADRAESLTAEATRERYGLGPPSSASAAVASLSAQDLLVRDDVTRFDSPFFRLWVRERTLPDLGR